MSREGHHPQYKTAYTVIQTFSANKTRTASVTGRLSRYKRNQTLKNVKLWILNLDVENQSLSTKQNPLCPLLVFNTL